MDAPPPPPPPPPPPHGNNGGHSAGGNRSGLPDGPYDIFIIPPHSSGGGFLYLPSLGTHRNSFLAGVACTLLAVAIWTIVFPVLKEWLATIVASGGMGVVVLMAGMGVAGWAWGKTQMEGDPGSRGAGKGGGGASNTYAHTNGSTPGGPHPGGMPGHHPGGMPGSHSGGMPGPQPGAQPGPMPGPPPGAGVGSEPPPRPKPTWQRSTPASGSAGASGSKTSWEKAREETRKREEERKKAEELRKKKEEEEKERLRQREKDARERELRELREARDKLEKEAKAAKEAEEARQAKEAREKIIKEAREAREKAVREAREKSQAAQSTTSRPESPTKRHQQPTAATEADDDTHSFRPYDKPKTHSYKTTSASSIYSGTSYAPSQSTARSTPPPSTRGPYHTKDPDKIVIKAVYAFNNAFMKNPIAQLASGMGSVTDGLILRITTEGLFIDDDVRGVPQREWDVKAWTMKLVEVWCPEIQPLGASSGSSASRAASAAGRSAFFGLKGSNKEPSNEETDAFLEKLLPICKSRCRGEASRSQLGSRSNMSASQSAEHKGLHVLRASIRDQEGKRYVFILQEEEGWKVAVGLQRLRRGTQVRALGVSGLPANETKAILENMGYL